MKKLIPLFVLAMLYVGVSIGTNLYADDKPAPTVDQLQAQIAAKDQQIAFLQRQLVLSQREETLHRQGFHSCLDEQQQSATQQRRPTAPATQP